MKRTEPRSFADIFNEGIARAGASNAFAAQRACYLWPEIVGPGVNSYTFRRNVEGSTLHIYISSAPLKNELSFHRTTLLDRLNAAVGCQALTDIVFH